MHSKPNKWKTLSSDIILDHPGLKVSEHKVRLPSGKVTEYVRHAPAESHSVCIIAVNNDGDVLIQREYSYPPDKIMWQLPGGSILPDEPPITAANRELSEESGLRAKKLIKLGYFYIHNRLSDKKQFVFLGTDLIEKKLPADDDEFIENHWLTQAQLREKIANGEFVNINLLAALNIWYSKQL